MSKETGGAAFPDPGRAQSAQHRKDLTETGMTLRDYFAAQALTGLINEPSEGRGGSTAGDICAANNKLQDNVQGVLAHAAYSIADAMLAERAK
ncbi:hypothetical protein GJ699_02355 [Duganella sp. FT80W]|uniref:Uncharacterized protein n=1 Tax=Duganella guangzhouensis TaxID=2666084 RepID=A0A6I2KTT5_9BURK|nr:hypothetical protein [Duganella guangzhouensis]MRW88822.1 hypothetical protein [Duganella guangzhouensis]